MPTLTPALFHDHLNDAFQTARSLILDQGHAEEILILYDDHGQGCVFPNRTTEPFIRQSDLVISMIRLCHATAAIHVCEAWAAGIVATLPELTATVSHRRSAQTERRFSWSPAHGPG